MYGSAIRTEYDRQTGRARSVIGEVDTSSAGNVILRVGREAGDGWQQTEHVVLTPDEALALGDQMYMLVAGTARR